MTLKCCSTNSLWPVALLFKTGRGRVRVALFAPSGALNGMVVCKEAGQGHTVPFAALSAGVTLQLYPVSLRWK